MIKNLSEKAKQNAIKPFWSWNDNLEKEELCQQIEIMKKNGIEGFFMHARGGLITEYMSEEWFDKIKICLDKADELGMQAWAYDENGWPSGFADGKVPQKGIEYQQKHLQCTIYKYGNKLPENVIGIYRNTDGKFSKVQTAENDDIIISFTVNPYYIDIINADVITDFIKESYEKYYEKFGNRFGTSLKGFFTDEPQFANTQRIPWSFTLLQKFEEKYGYNLIDNLPLLFNDTDESYAFRYDFYSLINELLTTSYFKQIYEWCDAHNCKFTGHSMLEDGIAAQMAANCGVMPSYEFMHEPGIDWLMRIVAKSGITAKQLGSAAAQLNKKTMTETFAGCGWDVSLNELKGIAQSQIVHGVKTICTHLQSYSTRGERKRDWPASLYIQQPWFNASFKQFSDYFTKLSALLAEAKEYSPLLVIHPIKSAYLKYNPNDLKGLADDNGAFGYISTQLHANHIGFHYGDETIMKNHGKALGATLKVGSCEYKYVLIPRMISIDDNTLKLLLEYSENGGKIFAYKIKPSFVNGRTNGELEKLNKNITIVENIEALSAQIDDDKYIITNNDECIVSSISTLPDNTDIYYLVNIENSVKKATFKIKGKKYIADFNPITEIESPIPCSYFDDYTCFDLDFAQYGSFVLKVTAEALEHKSDITEKIIDLSNEFRIEKADNNCVTLDKCEYRINNGEWKDKKYILHIQQELLALKKPCDVELKYRFNIKDSDAINDLKFFIETPEKYTIYINDKMVEFKDCGKFYDKSVRGTDISSYAMLGENTITLQCDFYQDENVYRVLFTPGVHEVERNKLTYNTELEACYLTGNFGVEFDGDFTYGERKSIFCDEDYSLVKSRDVIDITKITEQNFWFFQGKMNLEQSINISKDVNTKYYIGFKTLNCPAAHIYINDEFAGDISFAPHKVDVTNLLVNGENKVTVKLLSGNRNLLGPHHRVEGEIYSVSPDTFTKTLKHDGTNAWNDGYSFVKFGAELY